MNAKICNKIGLSALLVAFMLSNSGIVKAKELEINHTSSTNYSACTNPGLFSGDFTIDTAKYKAIYLGYCTERGNNDIVITPTKKKKDNKTVVVISTPKPPTNNPTEIPNNNTPESPKATKTPKITKTPTPAPTESCDSKNKNDDKKEGENPCDGNAGGGNG